MSNTSPVAHSSGPSWLTILFTISLCLPQYLTGQDVWASGTLSMADGSQRSGEVQTPNPSDHLDFVLYREATDATPEKYTPEQVTAFTVGTTKFETFQVTFDGAPPAGTQKLPDAAYPDREETGFLRIIIQGPLSLLSYVSTNRRTHYFLREALGDALTYLPYRPRLAKVDNGQVIRNSGSYRGVLAEWLLVDCPGLSKAISKVEYDEKQLLALMDNYYGCTQTQPEHREAPLATRLLPGVTGGLGTYTLRKADLEFDDALNGANGLGHSFGLRLRIVPPAAGYRYFIELAALRYRYEVEGVNRKNEDINGSTVIHHMRGIGYGAELGGGYQLLQGKFSLGILANAQLAISPTDEYREENYIDGVSSFQFPLRTYDRGTSMVLGGGVSGTYGPLELTFLARIGERQAPQLNLYGIHRLDLFLTFYPWS